MKKLLLLLLLLTACAPVAPEIIYVEITTTPEPTSEVQLASPEFYFNSWEVAKQDQATGMYFLLGEDVLIFASDVKSALHEVGHFDDKSRDYPSYSVAFQITVDEYINNPPADVQNELHHYLYVVIVERGRMYDDAYAQLYMWNILYDLPDVFEVFYAR